MVGYGKDNSANIKKKSFVVPNIVDVEFMVVINKGVLSANS